MPRYRDRLPQMNGDLFLTDGGLETTLVFQRGVDLPEFAAFHLLTSEPGRRELYDCYVPYAEVAVKHGVGLILETPTWRANKDWGEKLGHDGAALAMLNQEAVLHLQEIRHRFETPEAPIVISGNLGPRGDGYAPDALLSPDEAEAYHLAQVEAFANSHADLVTALTMTHAGEAIGIVRAARRCEMPVVIAFTVETDGRLPTGQPLGEAIAAVDEATDAYAAYYGINCAHTSHFAGQFAGAEGAPWVERIRMIRGNASKKSHAELDECTELDDGNPQAFGRECASLHERLPNLNVLGGCCGTDERHIGAVAECVQVR